MLGHIAFAAGLAAALLTLPASASLDLAAPVPVDPALRTGTVEVSIPTSPEHVEKLRAAIFAEIERMQREGPTMEELDKVRLAWTERYRQALQDNGFWLARLQASTFDGIDPSHILNFEQDSAALTPAQVQAAARRYFDLANYLEVVRTPSPQGAPAYNP